MLKKIFKIKGAYVFYILGLFILLSASLVFTKAFAATDNISGSKPIEVKIALQIDQISDVNQKAENFTIVGSLIMQWNDSRLAFDTVNCNCKEKLFDTSQFEKFTSENKVFWPRFMFYNQQGNRWIQEDIFQVFPNGNIVYYERFTLTLQAPDFNFLSYPFDKQKFDIHIVSLRYNDTFVYVIDLENMKMGGQLGEEEWNVDSYSTFVDTVTLFGAQSTNSQFTFTFNAHRHLEYYIFRIFLPLFLIITVAYATFFMKDYAKRVAFSAANLLTFVMFNFAVGSDLPRLGYLTFIDSLLVLSFVVTAVTVIANVFLKRLDFSGRPAVVSKLDNIIIWSYPLLYIFGLGVICFIYFP